MISATATARDCNRAYLEALRVLIDEHGETLTSMRMEERSPGDGRREDTDLTVNTEVLLGALFRERFVTSQRDKSGNCVAEIKITREDFANAQNSWLQLLETQRGQAAVLNKLDQLEKQLQDDAQLGQRLRDDIQELQDAIRRAQRQPPTGIRAGPLRKRLPVWPFAVGAVGAGAMVALQIAEDQRLQTAIAERRRPRIDLERMVQQRDQWRRAAIASGAGAVAYLILRELVGSAPSSNHNNLAEAGWWLAVEPGGVHLTWRFNTR
jgi:hypothetical protein